MIQIVFRFICEKNSPEDYIVNSDAYPIIPRIDEDVQYENSDYKVKDITWFLKLKKVVIWCNKL